MEFAGGAASAGAGSERKRLGRRQCVGHGERQPDLGGNAGVEYSLAVHDSDEDRRAAADGVCHRGCHAAGWNEYRSELRDERGLLGEEQFDQCKFAERGAAQVSSAAGVSSGFSNCAASGAGVVHQWFEQRAGARVWAEQYELVAEHGELGQRAEPGAERSARLGLYEQFHCRGGGFGAVGGTACGGRHGGGPLH